MAEKKNSDCERLTLALYRSRGDDEQDAILAWMDTLPRKEDGSFQREVLRKHMMRAMYQYVVHGTPKYPLNVQASSIPAKVEAPKPAVMEKPIPASVFVEKELERPEISMSITEEEVPVLTEVEVPSRVEPKKPGKIQLRSGMAKKIASSLHSE